MLDIGFLVYGSLLCLAIWRKVFGYWCCGLWLSILNYMSLLYVLSAAGLTYLLIGFYQAAQMPVDASAYPEAQNLWSISWLKPFVLLAPIAACLTMALGWLLTESHVFEIHKRLALIKHDRAVQIIALPTVFGLMALAAMLPVFELTTGQITVDMLASPWYDFRNPFNHIDWSRFSSQQGPQSSHKPAEWKDAKVLALWRYETCFYVADLFEAWALFQFGRLILERVSEAIGREADANVEKGESLTKAERDLADSHRAVTSLTWVGTSLFVACCVTQSACSLWPYLGGSRTDQESIMFHLQVAGFVSSCAAIYNLVVVETAFVRHLEPLCPMLKFLSVKILVSLCFVQRGFFSFLQACDKMLPETTQKTARVVPLLGDIFRMSDLQLHLFYPALIIFECLALAILNLLVWKSNEGWYLEEGTEHEPLVKSS